MTSTAALRAKRGGRLRPTQITATDEFADRLASRRAKRGGASIDFLAWAMQVPEAKTGPLNFEAFAPQHELYAEGAHEKEAVVKKATQIGMSAWAIRWALYHADTKGRSGLYIFPTKADMYDFATLRIQPVINGSEMLRAPAQAGGPAEQGHDGRGGRQARPPRLEHGAGPRLRGHRPHRVRRVRHARPQAHPGRRDARVLAAVAGPHPSDRGPVGPGLGDRPALPAERPAGLDGHVRALQPRAGARLLGERGPRHLQAHLLEVQALHRDGPGRRPVGREVPGPGRARLPHEPSDLPRREHEGRGEDEQVAVPARHPGVQHEAPRARVRAGGGQAVEGGHPGSAARLRDRAGRRVPRDGAGHDGRRCRVGARPERPREPARRRRRDEVGAVHRHGRQLQRARADDGPLPGEPLLHRPPPGRAAGDGVRGASSPGACCWSATTASRTRRTRR